MSTIRIDCQVGNDWYQGTMWQDDDTAQINKVLQEYVQAVNDPVFPTEVNIIGGTLGTRTVEDLGIDMPSTILMGCKVFVNSYALAQDMIKSTADKRKEVTYYKVSKDSAGNEFRWKRVLYIKFIGPIT